MYSYRMEYDEWSVFAEEYHDYLRDLDLILYERALDGDYEQPSFETHDRLWSEAKGVFKK